MAATEFELAVMKELSEIKTMAATAAAAATNANNTAVAASTALHERLFNSGSGVITTIQSDIQEIKDDRETEAKWNRLHNVLHYSIAPLLITIHELARKLGFVI